jgi:pyruvate/2-oxoglutarate dehydrogenase complex dihydrolipoamide acyltransferase (E2) component
MEELHALVDFENVQPTLDDLARLAPGFTDLWLFHGPHQVKQAQQMAEAHSGVTLVPRSGKGKNALDFHLSFYLGYVAAKHPDAHLVVVANDKGYDPMIAHARMLKFTVRRVGHKATPAKAVKPSVRAAATVVAQAAGKTPVPAAKAAPAKAPAPAKKAAAKKAPAKKTAVVKNVPATKVVAKRATPAKPPAPKAPAPAKPAAPAMTAETKAFARVKKAVMKMGPERPTKTQSFLRHIGAMLGRGSTAEQISAMVAQLEAAKVVRVDGNVVAYS